jgi:hypothetical protein
MLWVNCNRVTGYAGMFLLYIYRTHHLISRRTVIIKFITGNMWFRIQPHISVRQSFTTWISFHIFLFYLRPRTRSPWWWMSRHPLQGPLVTSTDYNARLVARYCAIYNDESSTLWYNELLFLSSLTTVSRKLRGTSVVDWLNYNSTSLLAASARRAAWQIGIIRYNVAIFFIFGIQPSISLTAAGVSAVTFQLTSTRRDTQYLDNQARVGPRTMDAKMKKKII